jgi:hypothetical protein
MMQYVIPELMLTSDEPTSCLRPFFLPQEEDEEDKLKLFAEFPECEYVPKHFSEE